MTTILRTALAAGAALALAAPAMAQTDMAKTDMAGADMSGRKLSAHLTGAAEVPGPGDTDGMGMIEARVNPGQTQFCYTLTASMIGTATMAHIHKGADGVAGPVVIPLTAPATGKSEACVTITRDLAMALIQSPGDYYTNVHNAEFPAGAIRGQLGK